jgi:uncharacterized protein (DUF1778 family)
VAETAINIRVSRRDLALIDKGAEIEGKTRSAFLRDSAEAYAMSILQQHWRARGAKGDCPLCGRG